MFLQFALDFNLDLLMQDVTLSCTCENTQIPGSNFVTSCEIVNGRIIKITLSNDSLNSENICDYTLCLTNMVIPNPTSFN